VLLDGLLPPIKFYAAPAAFLRPVVAKCSRIISWLLLHCIPNFGCLRSTASPGSLGDNGSTIGTIALRCLDRCEAPERTRPASYIRVDTLGLRGPALGRSGKCSARYLAPRYCTLLNHTQGISHKPLRRAGAFQAAAYSRRTAPSAIGESVGTEFCATTASRAAVSRAVDSCSSRLCSEAAARRAQEAGLFPRIRRRRVWRSRGVTRREQSARGAEQQGCHCAPCTRRANVPLVCKVRSCLRRSCCLPCGSHFFDPTGLQNKLPGCRLVTLVLFFAGLGGSTVQS